MFIQILYIVYPSFSFEIEVSSIILHSLLFLNPLAAVEGCKKTIAIKRKWMDWEMGELYLLFWAILAKKYA